MWIFLQVSLPAMLLSRYRSWNTSQFPTFGSVDVLFVAKWELIVPFFRKKIIKYCFSLFGDFDFERNWIFDVLCWRLRRQRHTVWFVHFTAGFICAMRLCVLVSTSLQSFPVTNRVDSKWPLALVPLPKWDLKLEFQKEP